MMKRCVARAEDDEDIKGLSAGGGFFCAGFLEPQEGREGELWDVYVDIPARKISIAEKSAKDFVGHPSSPFVATSVVPPADLETVVCLAS